MWRRGQTQKEDPLKEEAATRGKVSAPPGYRYWSPTAGSSSHHRKRLDSPTTGTSAWLTTRTVLWIALLILVVDLTVLFYEVYPANWRFVIQVPGVFGAVVAVIAAIIVVSIGYKIIIPAGARKTISQNAALVSALLALAGVLIAQSVNAELNQQTQRTTQLRDYLSTAGELPSNPDPGAAAAVQAQTLTLLPQLDPDQKRTVMQFLYQANLINKDDPRINLYYADLTSANLKGYDALQNRFILDNADLRLVNLTDADLDSTSMKGVRLSPALLTNTNFSNADLSNADLSHIGLNNTNLSGATLSGTDLSGTDLQLATGLTQEQIDEAYGDEQTQLPPGLQRPASWS
jgi:uncharacterized protein YjbI with pentapeptide repeats